MKVITIDRCGFLEGLIWKVQFLKLVRFRHSFLCHLQVHKKSENPENLNKISHLV